LDVADPVPGTSHEGGEFDVPEANNGTGHGNGLYVIDAISVELNTYQGSGLSTEHIADVFDRRIRCERLIVNRQELVADA
jgi:hypothetical protein